MDPTGKLTPLNATQAPAPVDVAVDSTSLTEDWIAKHPDGEAFDENAPDPVTPPIPLEDDEADDAGDEDDASTDDAPDATATDDTAPADAPDVKPTPDDAPLVEAKTTTDEKPAVVTPAPEAKPTYGTDEKFSLAEGVEWTRGQIVDALKERVTLQPKAAEAERFAKVFRLDATKAEEVWAPIVERLTKEPETRALLGSYFDDAEKKAYIDQCSAYYDSEHPPATPVAAPPVAALPPEVAQRLERFEKFTDEQQKRADVDRFNSEVDQVRARYPFVVADNNLFNGLRETAKYMWQADNSKGLLDALALLAPQYEMLAIARAQQPADPTPAVPPAPTLSGSGAAPAATRSRSNNRPRKYADTDEATAAWLADHPGDNFTE